jgi:hypothetical protein
LRARSFCWKYRSWDVYRSRYGGGVNKNNISIKSDSTVFVLNLLCFREKWFRAQHNHLGPPSNCFFLFRVKRRVFSTSLGYFFLFSLSFPANHCLYASSPLTVRPSFTLIQRPNCLTPHARVYWPVDASPTPPQISPAARTRSPYGGWVCHHSRSCRRLAIAQIGVLSCRTSGSFQLNWDVVQWPDSAAAMKK